MTISLICAVDKNMVIADSTTNDMPWGRDIPEDLKFFREQTKNHVVVYGRKTFESMGSKPLPFRTNIVLTHHHFNIHPSLSNTYAFTMTSMEEVINYHKNHLHTDRKMFICGGESLYRKFLLERYLIHTDEIILTHIDAEFKGDVKFPLSQKYLNVMKQEVLKTVPISDINIHPLKMIKYTNW